MAYCRNYWNGSANHEICPCFKAKHHIAGFGIFIRSGSVFRDISRKESGEVKPDRGIKAKLKYKIGFRYRDLISPGNAAVYIYGIDGQLDDISDMELCSCDIKNHMRHTYFSKHRKLIFFIKAIKLFGKQGIFD